MARAKAKAAGRKTVARKPRKKEARFTIKGLLYAFLLIAFFLFSVGVLTYVVFFRMVVAAELSTSHAEIVFEEPEKNKRVIASQYGASLSKNPNPQIAIIIDDMGYHLEVGKKLIEMDVDLSFSFLPHAPFTPQLEKMAYKGGKTVMLHLPLQPRDDVWDPGPGALLLDELSNQRETFLQNLAMVNYATGVNNHMGSLYTENRYAMMTLLHLVAEKKMFFIDSFTSAESAGFEVAENLGLRAARRDLFLDNIQEKDEICSNIDQLVVLAKSRGKAIGIAHPHQQTLEAMEDCLVSRLAGVPVVAVEELLH